MDTQNTQPRSVPQSQVPLSSMGSDGKQKEWQEKKGRIQQSGKMNCVRCGEQNRNYMSPIKKEFCRGCLGDLRNEKAKLRGGAKAAYLVNRAIVKGQIAKLDGTIACVDCGAVAVDYDHRNYNVPLQVDPVCRRCNLKRGPALAVL